MDKKQWLGCVALVSLVSCVTCCDLEEFFAEKQVSIEESARAAKLVFRGLSTNAVATPPSLNDVRGVFTAYFELINTYKGADTLDLWDINNYRKLNVTIYSRPVADCTRKEDIPREYIVFCDLVGSHLRVLSIAKWDEYADERVWGALGWTAWSDWSGCSVSCSAGIQQRIRYCRHPPCPGFNVEQRHCNMFGCLDTVNPLEVEETRYFHPSKEHWIKVPDRPSAWRLTPNSYIWLPSMQLFNNTSTNTSAFPKEFVLFITLRLLNNSLGTIFSLRSRRRQDTYLSLEIAGPDLKLIHAASNGTDVVRIPVNFDDGKWHQITISLRDDSVIDSFVDCEWSRTDVLRKGSLDIPEDSDLIIGYLFAGDIEQLTIVPTPVVANLQCSSLITPIIDPSITEAHVAELKPKKSFKKKSKKIRRKKFINLN